MALSRPATRLRICSRVGRATTTLLMSHVRRQNVRNMISPETWRTISPSRKPVWIMNLLSRRNMKMSWSASSHFRRPTVAPGWMRSMLFTMAKVMFSARRGASEYGPW